MTEQEHEPAPITITENVSDVRQRWRAIIDQVAAGSTRVIVERRGEPLAVVISAEDFERLQELDCGYAKQRQAIAALRESVEVLPDDVARIQSGLDRLNRQLEDVQSRVRKL